MHALSDANRRTVVEALGQGEATVSELATLLPIARPGVSRHLRVLREAGLVEVRREAQWRVYRLRPEPLAEIDEWLGRYRVAVGAAAGRVAHRSRPGQTTTKEHEMMSDRTVSGGLAGSLRTTNGKVVVRMEDRYRTDADDLWSALTDPERLARWIAQVNGDLRPGGAFEASFTSGWEGPGRVDVCEPRRRLVVTLSPGEEEQTEIEVELVPDSDMTRLVVEERGIPLDEGAVHGAGWQAHIEDLAAHLAGQPTTEWRTRWTELIPAYQEQERHLG